MKIYRITDSNCSIVRFVELSEEQIRFLEWLINNDFIYDEILFELSELPEIEKI